MWRAASTRGLALQQSHSRILSHAKLPPPAQASCTASADEVRSRHITGRPQTHHSAAFWPADRPDLTHATINPTSHRPRGHAQLGSKAPATKPRAMLDLTNIEPPLHRASRLRPTR